MITDTVNRRSARWDAQNIFSNYFVVAGTQIGAALFSFTTVWIANKLYAAEGYGNIVAIIAGSQAIQLFTNWSNASLARYGVEEFVETGSISNAFWSRTFIFIPNLVVVILTAPFWIFWLLSLLRLPNAATPFIILSFAFSVFWLHIQQALLAVKMPRLQGLLILVERVIILLLITVFGFVLKLSWLYAFYSFIIATFIVSVIGCWQVRHLFSAKPVFNKTWVRKLLSFSIPLIPYSLTSFFCTNYLDTFFITKYLSKSELGIYSVGYQINGLVLQFLVLIGTLLMPMFVTLRSRGHDKFIRQYIEDILPIFTLVWGILISISAIFFGYLIPIIFGNTFTVLSSIIWVFMSGTTFALPLLIGYSPFATAASAVYVSFPLALVTGISNVIGDMVLIPKWGLIGSAWATSLSAVLSLLSLILLINWRFRFRSRFLIQCIAPTVIGLISYLLFENKWLSTSFVLITGVTLVAIYKAKMKESMKFVYVGLIKKELFK